MKKLLLLILPLLAIAVSSCSSSGDEEPQSYQPKTATLYARGYLSATEYIGNGKWTIGDISYNQLETDILYYDKKADFSTETGWCSLKKDGVNLIITATENTDEYKYRRCSFGINTGSVTIRYTVTQNTLEYTSEELESIMNGLIQVGNNDIGISNGKFYYNGDNPFEIAITLSKKIDRIEKFYPYSLHYNEYIRISGDDKKNIKLDGVALISDFVYDAGVYPTNYYKPYSSDRKAGTYDITVSGAYNKTFSYNAQ